MAHTTGSEKRRRQTRREAPGEGRRVAALLVKGMGGLSPLSRLLVVVHAQEGGVEAPATGRVALTGQ